jgi:hypothetical protein
MELVRVVRPWNFAHVRAGSFQNPGFGADTYKRCTIC